MANDARKVLSAARAASNLCAHLTVDQKNRALKTFADAIQKNSAALLKANAQDMKAAKGIAPQLLARLELSQSKLDSIVKMVLGVRDLEDPTGKILQHMELDRGLELVKKTVPLGVLVVVFESRPDVIPQITSLILKSGNAVVLKGGSEARLTNTQFEKVWLEVGKDLKYLPKKWVQQVGGRDEFRSLLKHHDLIDLVIPRGSNRLVSSVMASTKAPVLGHAEGICSMFVHESAILEQALELVIDAKLQAPSTCNAIETLLVHAPIAAKFFKMFADINQEMHIEVRGCPRTRKLLKSAKKATEKDFRTEFGDSRLAVKVVDDLDAAIAHINSHGSHHTDAIIGQDAIACGQFLEDVDSATVLANASTRFADGYRLGLGAEVGVSTSKIHARGPAGLDSLVTTKYVVRGEGQVVSDYIGPDAKPFKHRQL